MKVLLINGSPHEKGCTFTALSEIKKTLENNNIEAEIFHSQNILGVAFRGGGGEQTVGPVALVECSELEVVLVVELQTDDVVVTHLH